MAFADRTGRLGRRWDSRRRLPRVLLLDHRPAARPDDPLLRHYLEHDLRDGLVRLSADALVEDGRDTFFGDVPWRDVGVPVRWTHAEWSIGRDSAPMYPADVVERYAAQCVSVVALDGLDHAGAIMTVRGAQATAALLREALA